MAKKLLMMLLVLLSAAVASADEGVGNWIVHPTFAGSEAQDIIDTGNKVYYLVSKNLYCYDKQTQENETLNKRNYLNDVNITHIYYNQYKKYLMVVYENSNIDIIKSDGSVVNIPDINDALLTYDKTVNDVTFSPAAAYVATGFGYLVINDNKWEVKESRVLGVTFRSVAVVGDWMLLSSTNGYLYYGKTSDPHEYLGSFKSMKFEAAYLRPISDKRFICITGWLFTREIKENSDGTITLNGPTLAQEAPTSLHPIPDGFVANFGPKKAYYYTIDSIASTATKVDNASKEMLASSTAGEWWAVGTNGLRQIKDGTAGQYFKPNALTMAIPFFMVWNNNDNKLYVSSSGTNTFFTNQSAPTRVNTYDGTTWTEVSTKFNNYTGTYGVVPDPDDPQVYYLGSWWNGVFKVRDGKIVLTYGPSNSPMEKQLNWYTHGNPFIDRAGTLWVVQTGNEKTPIMALPKAKRLLDKVTKEDWYTPSIPNMSISKFGSVLAMKNTDDKIVANGGYQLPMVFFNDGGNPASSSYKSASYTSFTDQDNKTFSWTNVLCLTEDLDGRVWMGTNSGVVSFNPAEAYSSNFQVNHIKVPRNDGTNLADYLLDGQQVNCIAVDGSNRKWLGTNGQGLFLVSADGSKVLKQFTSSNSYLLSDIVYRVCCDPNSNSVFITTDKGLSEYKSDAAPSSNDYSNVYAYPNPVRPDYTGSIVINGLMDNSLVKIADASGFVVRSLKSNGGLATWDGCDSQGRRVKTGVYFVFASQSSTEGSGAAVTKIMVIR